MRTVTISTPTDVEEFAAALGGELAEGRTLSVTIARSDELLSPEQVAQRLGFSRQHVRRLIEAGKLDAEQLPNSRYWKIPLASVLAFEEQRERGRQTVDKWAADMHRLGVME